MHAVVPHPELLSLLRGSASAVEPEGRHRKSPAVLERAQFERHRRARAAARRVVGPLGRPRPAGDRITRVALRVGPGSAEIMAGGEYGTTTISSGSGAVTVGHITSAASLQAGSGNLRIGAASGDLDVATGCGDLVIGSVTGVSRVKSGSGDVRIDAVDRATCGCGSPRATSALGSWRGRPPGSTCARSAAACRASSRSVRRRRRPGSRCASRLESVGGDIDLVGVHGAATAEVPQPPSPATAH